MTDSKLPGANCASCPLQDAPLVYDDDPPDAVAEWRGERPGAEEAKARRPFVGSTGKVADQMWRTAGVDRTFLRVSNAIACYPGFEPEEDVLDKAEACCRPRFALKKPLPIVAMGNLAIRSAGGNEPISEVAGVPLPISDTETIFPVFHPAVALPNREPAMMKVLRVHAERAQRWTRGELRLWEFPEVITNLTHTESDCLRALDELLDRSRETCLGLDVENPMVKKALDWDTSGRRLLDVGIADGSLGDEFAVCISWETASEALKHRVLELVTSNDITFTMHNGEHDARVFHLATGVTIPGYKIDSMHLFKLLFPGIPARLAMVSSFLTEFPRHKDEFQAETAERKRETGDRFASADPLSRAIYCGRDALVQAVVTHRMIQHGGLRL